MASVAPPEGEVTLDSAAANPAAASIPNPLSEREMDVARLLATGASNAEIARELVISPHTVKVHLRNIFEKLQVSSRTEATMALVQNGWLEVAGAVRSDAVDEAAQTVTRDPEPLDDVRAQPAMWQRIFLLAALLVAAVILVAPWFARPVQSSAPLLSDVGAAGESVAPVSLDARWEALAPMPAPRSRHAVARVGSVIYSFGGEGANGEVLSDVLGLDLRVNRWRTARNMPAAASNLAAAAVGEAIYVAGGTLAATDANTADSDDASAQINGQLWRYLPEENAWRVLGNLPAPVAGASLSAVRFNGEDALVLAGGWDGESVRDEVWLLPVVFSDTVGSGEVISESVFSLQSSVFSEETGNEETLALDTESAESEVSAFTSPLLSAESGVRWQLLTRLPAGRAFMGATVVGDDLYIVGGFDGQQELANADRYNLASGRWERLAPLHTPRSAFALVYDDVALHALGGGWLESVDTNERFDLATETWAATPSPVAGSWRHLGAASADGGLYLLGGWNGDYMDLAIAFQSTFRSLLPVITNP